MDVTAGSAVVTGGASGLGLATARRLVEKGVPTVLVDLPTSAGAEVAAELGGKTRFVAAEENATKRPSALAATKNEKIGVIGTGATITHAEPRPVRLSPFAARLTRLTDGRRRRGPAPPPPPVSAPGSYRRSARRPGR